MRLPFAAVLVLCGFSLAAAAAEKAPSAQASSATAPAHAQFLPPDEQGLREGAPEQQQLLQVTSFTVVAGNQRPSNQQPIPVTAPLTLSLKGKPLSKGATVNEVVITFDVESKSLKRPAFDDQTRVLSLNYPMAQYRILLDLLRNGQVYVQFLSYPNGHVWADLHTGSVRVR